MRLCFILCVSLIFGSSTYSNLEAQDTWSTSGDQSPAIFAKGAKVHYQVDVRTVLEMVEQYKAPYPDRESRYKVIRQLIKDYQPLRQSTTELNPKQIKSLGIAQKPEVVNALNFDLFLSTKGHQSPAVFAPGGFVEIWYGLPPEVFKRFWNALEDQQILMEEFQDRLFTQVKLYKSLRIQLDSVTYKDQIFADIKMLLEEGEFTEAETQMNRLLANEDAQDEAAKHHIFGKIKELNFKYQEAEEQYYRAVGDDRSNLIYQLDLARTRYFIGSYRLAVEQLNNFEVNHTIGTFPTKLQAAFHQQLGRIQLTLGYYMQARKHFEYVLKIYSVNYQANQIELTQIYGLLSNIMTEFAKYDSALHYLQKAEEIYLAQDSFPNTILAEIYTNQGNIHLLKGQFDRALELQQAALKQCRLTNPSRQIPLSGLILNNIGQIFYQQSIYDSARIYTERGLVIQQRSLGKRSLDVLACYQNLALTIAKLANVEKAYNMLDSARLLLVKLNPTHSKLASIYNNMSQLQFLLSSSANNTIKFLHQSIAIDTAHFGNGSHPKLILRYINLGNAYLENNELTAAAEAIQTAWNIYQNTFAEQHPILGLYYSSLAKIYSRQSKYPAAIRAIDSALVSTHRFLDSTHLNFFDYYLQKSTYYYQLSQYGPALRACRTAEKIIEKSTIVDSTYRHMHLYYQRMGDIHYYLAAYDSSVHYYQKRIQGLRSHNPQNNSALALAYYDLSFSFGKLRQNLQGLQANFQALDLLEGSKSQNNHLLSMVYQQVSAIYYLLCDYVKSTEFQELAKSLAPNRYNRQSYHHYLGLISLSQGKFKEAFAHLTDAEKAAPKKFSSTYERWIMYYNQTGDYNKALQYLREATENNLDLSELLRTNYRITAEFRKLPECQEIINKSQRKK